MAYLRRTREPLSRLLHSPSSSSSSSSSFDRITNPILFSSHGLRYRKLEVILTTTIDKLGKAGETVKVAPGHFRNHLMPKLLAVPNIEKYAFLIREQRKLYQREEEEEEKTVEEVPKDQQQEDKMKEYQAAAKRLDNARLDASVEQYLASLIFKNAAANVEPIIMLLNSFYYADLEEIPDSWKVLRRFIKVDNELRSPVTKEELVAEVARQLCVNIHPDNLHLPSPLPAVGEYEVPLRLPKEIPRPEGRLQWALNVKIRRK